MLRSEPDHISTETGGPGRAPRSVLRRLIRLLILFAVVVGGGTTLAVLAGRLPEGTEASSLIVRGLVGLSIGLVLTFVVRRMMRAFGDAPAAPPLPVDAREVDVVYVCPVCGTRVRLELAATTKAPRHCGEEMESSLA